MARLRGTIRRDALTGGAEDDRIGGGAATDRLAGRRGDDTMSGGDGADLILGGAGDDVLYGHGPGDANGASGAIRVTRIETGAERLVFATTAPGDDDNLYLIENAAGRILRFNPDTGASSVLLDLPDAILGSAGEEGLLGLAFHPGYASNGRFYIHFVNADGDVEIREYTRDGASAPLSSARKIIVIPHPDNTNHNGGTVAFGPDGLLYISVGDGGGGGDPGENAQDLTDLLGSILRIDVDGDDFPGDAARNYAIPAGNPFANGAGRGEIWDYGLRNPFRFTFDPETGALVIADVGQNAREEIDVHPAGAAGGLNFGWDLREGSLIFEAPDPGEPSANDPSLVDPAFEYGRDLGRSVTGGVFKSDLGGLDGAYLFADFLSGNVWAAWFNAAGRATDVRRIERQFSGDDAPGLIPAFVNGPDGRLYAASIDGSLSRLDVGAVAGDRGDTLRGGDGRDEIRGGRGGDMLFGGQGADTLFGGDGGDVLRGGRQRDVLRGERGEDDMAGGAGGDVLRGGGGGDQLAGGAGDDTLRGGPGDDTLRSGPGDDVLNGGAGADRFVFGLRAGDDQVIGFTPGEDRIVLRAYGHSGFGDLSGALGDAPGGATLNLGALGGSGVVFLAGVSSGQLDGDDFIF